VTEQDFAPLINLLTSTIASDSWQAPETAPLVAKLVISDLNSVAGMVQDGQLERGFASVVIDEFAAFAMPLFIDLLNKGRSAGMAITISHQSMRGDLAMAERGFVEQVADNTNIKICLRQSADAEYVAGLSGTYKTVKRTEQTLAAIHGHDQTGLGSAREVDEYHVSPNLIRQLPRGHAVVQMNAPATLDLVRLDHLDTAHVAAYSPPPQERVASLGLELRRRAARRDPDSPPPIAPATPVFEGA
jgi:type IV secretory pathway TraG/TraD family ATPase VirD4